MISHLKEFKTQYFNYNEISSGTFHPLDMGYMYLHFMIISIQLVIKLS